MLMSIVFYVSVGIFLLLPGCHRSDIQRLRVDRPCVTLNMSKPFNAPGHDRSASLTATTVKGPSSLRKYKSLCCNDLESVSGQPACFEGNISELLPPTMISDAENVSQCVTDDIPELLTDSGKSSDSRSDLSQYLPGNVSAEFCCHLVKLDDRYFKDALEFVVGKETAIQKEILKIISSDSPVDENEFTIEELTAYHIAYVALHLYLDQVTATPDTHFKAVLTDTEEAAIQYVTSEKLTNFELQLKSLKVKLETVLPLLPACREKAKTELSAFLARLQELKDIHSTFYDADKMESRTEAVSTETCAEPPQYYLPTYRRKTLVLEPTKLCHHTHPRKYKPVIVRQPKI